MVEFLPFLVALVASLMLTPLMIRCAYQFDILDIPQGSLKTHKKPTPYLGGIAVYMSLAGASIITMGMPMWLALFLAGVGFLCITGLIDDIYTLTAGTKFCIQSIGCLTLLISLTTLTGITPSLPMLCTSLFFLFTIVNAINLVDIMDALASTITLTATVGFAGLAFVTNTLPLLGLALATIGAIAGFLWFNRAPARIYLGDAGSLTLGGVIGFFALAFGWGTTFEERYFIAPCIAGVALIELISLIVIRASKGLPPYLGSPHHFAHYLKRKGWSWNKIISFTAAAGLTINGLTLACFMGKISLIQLLGVLIAGLVPWTFIVYRTPTSTTQSHPQK